MELQQERRARVLTGSEDIPLDEGERLVIQKIKGNGDVVEILNYTADTAIDGSVRVHLQGCLPD